MPQEIPIASIRVARMFSHDTSFARAVVSLGLILMGAAMLFNVGSGAAGYSLMEQVLPLPFWGTIYFGVGLWGVYGSVNRLPYWIRIFHTCGSMYLWVFICLAQFNDQPLPTRLLLILPALVDTWVLIKVVARGDRGDLSDL